MSTNPKKLLDQFLPFAVMGLTIVVAIGVLFIFFHLFIWGIILGALIWGANVIYNYFSPIKKTLSSKENQKKGRIIEHEKD